MKSEITLEQQLCTSCLLYSPIDSRKYIEVWERWKVWWGNGGDTGQIQRGVPMNNHWVKHYQKMRGDSGGCVLLAKGFQLMHHILLLPQPFWGYNLSCGQRHWQMALQISWDLAHVFHPFFVLYVLSHLSAVSLHFYRVSCSGCSLANHCPPPLFVFGLYLLHFPTKPSTFFRPWY